MTTHVLETVNEFDDLAENVTPVNERRTLVRALRRRWESFLAVPPVRTERPWPLTRSN